MRAWQCCRLSNEPAPGRQNGNGLLRPPDWVVTCHRACVLPHVSRAARPCVLSLVLDSIAGSLRSDEDLRAEVTAALGPARSTARLLAVLPVFGLVLGTSMGAHPLGFLLQTAAGWFCLVGGALLAVAGMWWVERLVRAVEESA
jgi:hypothetical protein